MAKAVVLYVSSQLHTYIIGPLLNDKQVPEQRFNTMLTTINSFYHEGKKNCLLNVLSLGEKKKEISELLNKDYSDWLDALIKLAKDAGLSKKEAKIRSEHFLIAIQGALVIQRLINNSQTFQNAMEYEEKLFFK